MPSSLIAPVVGAVAGKLLGGGSDNAASDANQKAIDANKWQGEIAQDQWNEYKKTYQPLEDQMVRQAQDYDTPFQRDQAAGKAQATVAEQFGKARSQLSRTPGLDPSSPAFTAAMAGLDTQQAASDATQQNMARKNVQDTAFARQMDTLGLGKGLVTNATTGLNNASYDASRIAVANTANANATAGNVGKFVGNIFSSQGFQSWLNTPSAGGAGSMNGSGSVQGNPNFEYDL